MLGNLNHQEAVFNFLVISGFADIHRATCAKIKLTSRSKREGNFSQTEQEVA